MTVHFLIPGDINTLTGGYVYDKIIAEGLTKLSYHVIIHRLADDFPFPATDSLKRCKQLLDSIPSDDPVFVDSLAFGPLYRVFEESGGKNLLIPVIHLPPSKNPNYNSEIRKKLQEQERLAYTCATQIVAVSNFTKCLITELGVDPEIIRVITPGVFDHRRKSEYPVLPEKILCIASYLPGKGQIMLIQALEGLKNYNWKLNFYGIQDFDTRYVQHVKNRVAESGLGNRIFINRQISGRELEEAYLDADLFVLPSIFENFSMALNDSLSFGVPVITTTGGGIPFSVPGNMGLFVSPGEVTALRQAIGKVLTNHVLYKQLCYNASQYFKSATGWSNSIHMFHSILLDLC